MIRRLLSRTDPWLLMIVAAMILLGLVMVYSASWDVSWRLYGDPNELFRRQLINLAYGMVVLVAAVSFPIRWLRKLALPIIGICVLALLLVLIINTGDGPRRAILGASVQPSEMAKLGLIIYLAVWMESKGSRLSEWRYGFLPLMTIIGIVGGLILLQPDLSAVLTIAVVALTMFYLAGSRLSQTFSIAAGSAVIGYVLVRLTNTGRARWDDYLAGLVNVEAASYHVQHSLQAFFAGGLLGRGLGASREKFGLLPAPHTDSIFAVLGEELGLAGALFVLLMFLAFLRRGFKVATEADDRLASLLAGGVTFWIGVEAFVNMSVLLGMLPFAGNALPFFSFGGSSLLVTLAGVGLLLNVSRQSKSKSKVAYVSPTGIGRRDGRRRVSRLGRRRRAQRAS
ncbi:MAG: FtsW/RodA/SpoVE family cell cycle protein [Chloroflexi bacterium]|nr:FtsW/RodA/SpoVE family cell cycle protein [Chloroflexota bacterium]MDK1044899.1 FtsW/RodA/SpoVE family cell cycle protein [Anaerolineales bacterium]MCH8341731.1 FtsW/RodA/SpoVE family cell cycle protein [Chloroflexota bacterium]MCH8875745.1 FtsW/RodA/SpoVE family cell cycle protein [Chloroflexota bacterium]MCI0773535.1 FtsW/RodA/SpoVE family cell cycle protein [Chloroflexota bacterium]